MENAYIKNIEYNKKKLRIKEMNNINTGKEQDNIINEMTLYAKESTVIDDNFELDNLVLPTDKLASEIMNSAPTDIKERIIYFAIKSKEYSQKILEKAKENEYYYSVILSLWNIIQKDIISITCNVEIDLKKIETQDYLNYESENLDYELNSIIERFLLKKFINEEEMIIFSITVGNVLLSKLMVSQISELPLS